MVSVLAGASAAGTPSMSASTAENSGASVAGTLPVSASTAENAPVSPRSGRSGANLGVRAALTASIAAERSSGWSGSGQSARGAELSDSDSGPGVTSNRRSPGGATVVSWATTSSGSQPR